ncbi:phage tail tube protein [Aquisphaera insulae]|uniref:phage tail tube protein n=1 Tax=Aquisphaera insulae TaxID=2712864 RepID=UPI0013EB9F1F|nr:phage tail tube protein [Aquisphaera insulae]
MGWGAQQWVRCTKEATYGTFNASATTPDIAWFRIVGDDAMTVRAVPQRQVIRSADGGNRRRQVVANRKVVSGGLATLFYPSQASYLLAAATTLTSNDLNSYTLDYFDSTQVQRFLGCKVQRLAVAGTAQQDYLTAALQWVGQSKSTATLAQPADSVFPTENPYAHYESKGLLSIGGTATKYSSLSVTVSNTLAPTWDEDQWITALYYAGRDVDASVRLQYVSATLRGNLETQAPLTVSAAWARSGGLTTTIDLKTKNYVASVDDNLPLGDATYQTIGIQAFYDSSASTDLAFTVA